MRLSDYPPDEREAIEAAIRAKRAAKARREQDVTMTAAASPFKATTMVVTDEPQWEWREVEIGKLVVPQSFQRDMKPKWVDFLAENWRPWEAGVLLIAFIAGIWYVVDGQHRFIAMRRLGVRTWMATVLYGFTSPEQARTFINVNRNRKSVDAIDLYRAGLEAGEEESVIIHRRLEDAGLFADVSAKHVGPIRAIGTLRRILKTHGEGTLVELLGIVRRAWVDADGTVTPRAFEAGVLAPLSFFIARSRVHAQWDADRLVNILRDRSPSQFLAAARNMAAELGRPLTGAGGETPGSGPAPLVLLGWYNHRLGDANRLPPLPRGGRTPGRD